MEKHDRRGSRKLRFVIESGIIAAVYAALTLLLAPISYGLIQVRVAEALCILPFFTPAAVPGLFIGCLIANAVGGLGVIDIVFGSLATLLSAAVAYKVKVKWLVPLPAVVVNAVVVGFICKASNVILAFYNPVSRNRSRATVISLDLGPLIGRCA